MVKKSDIDNIFC